MLKLALRGPRVKKGWEPLLYINNCQSVRNKSELINLGFFHDRKKVFDEISCRIQIDKHKKRVSLCVTFHIIVYEYTLKNLI